MKKEAEEIEGSDSEFKLNHKKQITIHEPYWKGGKKSIGYEHIEACESIELKVERNQNHNNKTSMNSKTRKSSGAMNSKTCMNINHEQYLSWGLISVARAATIYVQRQALSLSDSQAILVCSIMD